MNDRISVWIWQAGVRQYNGWRLPDNPRTRHLLDTIEWDYMREERGTLWLIWPDIILDDLDANIVMDELFSLQEWGLFRDGRTAPLSESDHLWCTIHLEGAMVINYSRNRRITKVMWK